MVDREKDLWTNYASDRSDANRDALVEFYLPWIRNVACNMASKLPNSVDPEDLVQDGALATVWAIERFDLSRGLKFKTFALPRVCGAMRDGLRHDDWVPRLERQRQKAGMVEPVAMIPLAMVRHYNGGGGKDTTLEDELGRRDMDMIRTARWEDIDHALRGLSRRDRLLMLFYYCEQLTMKEIGQILGLSESRVSQAHAATVEFLRQRDATALRA